MTFEFHIAVEAPRDQLVGTTAIVDGWPVHYVSSAHAARVKYRKFVADYSRVSARPWVVGKRKYGSLPNALRSLALEA